MLSQFYVKLKDGHLTFHAVDRMSRRSYTAKIAIAADSMRNAENTLNARKFKLMERWTRTPDGTMRRVVHMPYNGYQSWEQDAIYMAGLQ